MTKRTVELRKILDSLGLVAATIEPTSGGHLKIEHHNLNRQVITGSTPSDSRGNLNLRSDLRKCMIKVFSQKRGGRRFISPEDKQAVVDYMRERKLTPKQAAAETGYGKSSCERWARESLRSQENVQAMVDTHDKVLKELGLPQTVQGARTIDDIEKPTLQVGKIADAFATLKTVVETVEAQEATIGRLETELEEVTIQRDHMQAKLHLISETMGMVD